MARWIPTDRNWADIFTKPLAENKLYEFWKQMCGYEPWTMPGDALVTAGATQIEFAHWHYDDTAL